MSYATAIRPVAARFTRFAIPSKTLMVRDLPKGAQGACRTDAISIPLDRSSRQRPFASSSASSLAAGSSSRSEAQIRP